MRIALLLCTVIASSWPLRAQEPAETVVVYGDGRAAGIDVRAWFMTMVERAPANGGPEHLWLNDDCQAKPWAGVVFAAGTELLQLTDGWLRAGAIRFLVNGGRDQYGSPNGRIELQARVDVEGVTYQQIGAAFIDRGRGIDEDDGTWQEVVFPLSCLIGLKAGQGVTGVSIQCVDRPERPFGLAGVELLRYAELPEWLRPPDPAQVAQPWVSWPTYAELPSLLRAGENKPEVREGRFVRPDGTRVFLLSPYCREDHRLDLWGSLDGSGRAPTHGLYDRAAHGWIYEDLPTGQTLSRLGFNSYSATVPPQPWWQQAGFKESYGAEDPSQLVPTAQRLGVPFYVDLVCWPWTLGAPAEKPDQTSLPPEAFTQGQNHWTPYRITGAGRDAWLAMWHTYAQRYHDAGVGPLVVELMNEPSYWDVSDVHRQEFEAWLKDRYETLDRLNATWGTALVSFAEAAQVADSPTADPVAGRVFDYDDYLAGEFTRLIADGVAAVHESLPGALVGVQPMGGFALLPREAVWKHRIAREESVVITPTGGGQWTSGGSQSAAPADPLDAPIAGVPYENDLLLALAGDKMIVDNETYLSGQTAREVRNCLWEHVIAGQDGLTVFAWSKRGWAWWNSIEDIKNEADRFPYSALNPIARRTESLRGIHDFAAEIQPLADEILRKPWGPKPVVGLLYSWAQARRRAYDQSLPDKTAAYYAALKYGHVNFAMLPSDELAANGVPESMEVLIAGGVRYIEPEALARIEGFVRAGGILIVGEEPMAMDLYGRPLDTTALLGVTVGEMLPAEGAVVDWLFPGLPGRGAIRLTAGIRDVTLLADTEVLLGDSRRRPAVTEHRVGQGQVYFIAANVVGYPLLGILHDAQVEGYLHSVETHLTPWRLARMSEPPGDRMARNVLLSRRSYDDHHVLLLMNRDRYDKSLRICVDDIGDGWRAVERLRDQELRQADASAVWSEKALRDEGLPLVLPGGEPAVIVLTKAEE